MLGRAAPGLGGPSFRSDLPRSQPLERGEAAVRGSPLDPLAAAGPLRGRNGCKGTYTLTASEQRLRFPSHGADRRRETQAKLVCSDVDAQLAHRETPDEPGFVRLVTLVTKRSPRRDPFEDGLAVRVLTPSRRSDSASGTSQWAWAACGGPTGVGKCRASRPSSASTAARSFARRDGSACARLTLSPPPPPPNLGFPCTLR